MKVELEKLTMGYSPLTERIFVGVASKPGIWKGKVDLTNEFLACVIAKWGNQTETITDGENSWQITVKKINK